MPAGFLTKIIDVLVIILGTGIILNALIQVYIELRVKDAQGNRSYVWHKLARHLIFLILGMSIVLLRIWYKVKR